MGRPIKVAAVIALAAAGFAVASIASGSSVLGSATVTATTTAVAPTTTTATVTTNVTRNVPAKVTICHYTGSKKHPFVTIKVAASSLYAHFVVHHDLPGPCTAAKQAKILKAIKAAKHRH